MLRYLFAKVCRINNIVMIVKCAVCVCVCVCVLNILTRYFVILYVVVFISLITGRIGMLGLCNFS